MSEEHQAGRVRRVGVLSDTHHDERAIRLAMARLQKEGPLDALCFLGDCVSDLPRIEQCFSQPGSPQPQIYAVRGNNDFYCDFPDAYSLRIGGTKLLLVHGHLQRVKRGRLQLLLCAQEAEADIALFGHTHHTECGYEQGILLLNPGAASGASPSCALLTLFGGGGGASAFCACGSL